MTRLNAALVALACLLGSSTRLAAQPGPGASEGAPPQLDDFDRVLLDAAVAALAAGDVVRARALLGRAVEQGNTAEARAVAAVLLERVEALIAQRRAQPRPASSTTTNSAKTALMFTTTALGIAAWGWTLPFAVGVDLNESPRAMLGLYMVTATASFVVPLVLTRGARVDWGETNLAFYGGTRGLEYGLLVSNLLLGARGGSPTDNDLQAFSASVLTGSVAGLAGGYAWGRSVSMDAGRARTVAVMGDYGLFAGLVTAHVLRLDTLTFSDGSNRRDAQARSVSALGLAGTSLGLAGGWFLGAARDNSWGDGEVMRGAGLLGVLTGGALALLAGYGDDSRAVTTTLVLGGGLGLLAGDRLVRKTDFTVGQAVLIDLALLTGALGGAGLTYLLSRNDSATAYLSAATAGAFVGGGLAYAAQRDEHPRASGSRAVPTVAVAPRFGAGQVGLNVLGAF